MKFILQFICGTFLLFGACQNQQPAAPADHTHQQEPPVNPIVPYRLEFNSFSTADGLCSNNVTALFQDSRGLLWVGTDNGLNRYNGYQFEAFQRTAEDTIGTLCDNYILEITEDHKGDIWILTKKGFNKFDPQLQTITVFPDTILEKFVEHIYPSAVIDPNGKIWIKGRRPIYFDTRTQEYGQLQGFSEKDSTGNSKGLRLAYVLNPLDSNVYGICYIITEKETKFAGYFNASTATSFNPVELPRETWDPIRLSRVFFLDHKNNLWFDEPIGGLYKYSVTNQTLLYIPQGSGHPTLPRKKLGGTILDMCLAANRRNLWIAGYCGITRFELREDSVVQVLRYIREKDQPNTLPGSIVMSVLEDASGNIWGGTEAGGLAMWSPWVHKFDFFRQTGPDSLRMVDAKTNALFFDHKDHLWAATENGLCLVKNREQKHFKVFQQQKSRKDNGSIERFTGISEDTSANRLYLCYWGSFPNKMNPETGVFEDLNPSNYNREQWEKGLSWGFFHQQIKRSPNGVFYYADWDGLLGSYDPANREFTQYGSWSEKLPWFSSLTNCIWPEKDGTLWVGPSENKGIQRINFERGNQLEVINPQFGVKGKGMERPGEFTSFPVQAVDTAGLQNGVVNCFFRDSKNRFWTGTNGGLFLMTDQANKRFKKYGTQQGFPGESIKSIEEDAHGKLWVSTDKGLCCFNPDSGIVESVFDEKDGLQGADFDELCSAQNSYGLMAFGGANGFNIFHPDSIYVNTHIPQVAILRVSANKVVKPVMNNRLELPYDSSTLFIELAAMDFSDPEQNLFKYKIEGYEKDYCNPTSNNEVRYINLPPGTHRFHVQACNNDGVWNTEGTWLTIVVRPPFWLTWWFWLLLAGLAAYGIFRYFKWREAVLRRSNLIDYLKVQSLQAQLNPHFLFNVLATMQSRILNNDPEQASKMVVDLSKLMRNFLEATIAMDADKKGPNDAPVRSGITTQEITLAQELELLEMYIRFEQIKYENKFQYKIKYDRTEIVPGNESLPPLLIQPYVENAVKHGLIPKMGTEGQLLLHFYKDDHYLVCRIEDNGVGMKKSREQQSGGILLHKSRGKELVERRVYILNQGKYDIQITPPADREGGGTIVEIRIGYK